MADDDTQAPVDFDCTASPPPFVTFTPADFRFARDALLGVAQAIHADGDHPRAERLLAVSKKCDLAYTSLIGIGGVDDELEEDDLGEGYELRLDELPQAEQEPS